MVLLVAYLAIAHFAQGDTLTILCQLDWFDGAVLNATWRGPKLRDVLDEAGVSVKNIKENHVAFACYQTEIQSESWYGGSIGLEKAMKDDADVLVALEVYLDPHALLPVGVLTTTR
jgi:sulfite oxidase